MNAPRSLRALIDTHNVVVCVGSGGVGKTTTAASLALWGAMHGRRTMVLTIDPARRLAQSLGLEMLRGEPQQLGQELLREAGVEVPGSLHAAMLDQKSAWDEFIARNAPNPETAKTILDNEFYKHLSGTFAGSTEYMAVEELSRIEESGAYDLIVLDTPPTTHALDFLEAPQRLRRFLDRDSIRRFVLPAAGAGWGAWKAASKTARFLLTKLEDATGVQALGQVSEFFVAMETVFDGINERSARVESLLRGERTAFVLVAGPDEQVLDDSDFLETRMRELGMPLKAVVMNRVHTEPADEDDERWAEYMASLDAHLEEIGVVPDLKAWLLAVYEDARATANAESIRRESFELGLEDSVVFTAVPELDHDVHDIAGLAAFVRVLSGQGQG